MAATSTEFKCIRKMTKADECVVHSTINTRAQTDMGLLNESHAALEELVVDFDVSTLKWQADAIIYTDGSAQLDPEGRTHIGGGVCRPGTPSDLAYIKPCGEGPTNTINRAEISALAYAVEKSCSDQHDEIIATDSLCCLQIISKALRNPRSLKTSKHYELGWHIAGCLVQRAQKGLTTTFT
jgi:ribonuclease HI